MQVVYVVRWEREGGEGWTEGGQGKEDMEGGGRRIKLFMHFSCERKPPIKIPFVGHEEKETCVFQVCWDF